MIQLGTLVMSPIVMMTFLSMLSCAPSEPNKLDELGTVRMSIGNQKFDLWIANDDQERARGLMFVTAEQMAPRSDGTRRGMIFVFNHSIRNSFWMKNTIIPLDIAYLDETGKVITTYTMTPLDDRVNQYLPDAPYRFAIELNAQRLKELGIKKGDKLEIPPSVLKGVS